MRSKSPVPPVLSLLGLLVLAPALAADEASERVWSGFIRSREHFPLTTGFLILEPTSAFVLPAGRWEIEISATLSNTFSASQEVEILLDERQSREPFTEELFRKIAASDLDDQSFYLDSQVMRTALRLHRGFGRGLELGLLVPMMTSNGGFTDLVIEEFHDLIGFDQEGRKGVPRDDFGLFLLGQGREIVLEDTPGSVLGDIVMSLKKVVASSVSRKRSLAVEASLKLPTGDEDSLSSSGAADLGTDIVGSWCWTTRCAHASVGYAFIGSSDVLRTDSQALLSTAAGLEQALSARWSLTVQGVYWQSYLEDLAFEHFSEDTIQLVAALTLQTRMGELVVAFGENAFSFKNSADAIWHFAWRRRFD